MSPPPEPLPDPLHMPQPTPAAPAAPASQAVLAFWFEDGLTQGWPSADLNPRWFGGGPALDAQITQAFGPLVHQAVQGGLTDWENPPLQRLALVLLLDQFTRNVFRGQAQAFSGDARARGLVRRTLQAGEDTALPLIGRVFLLMPLMHAEDLTLQDECVARFQALHDGAPPERQASLQGNLRAAIQHRDIVARFGRFPHRNAVLGRPNTPEETAFLQDGPRCGQ